MVHLNYVRKTGIPTLQRVVEIKQAVERRVLAAHAAGGEDKEALDSLTVINEWLMVHSDPQLMKVLMETAMRDLHSAGAFNAKGGRA